MDPKPISEVIVVEHLGSRIVARFFHDIVVIQKQNTAFSNTGSGPSKYWRDSPFSVHVPFSKFEIIISEFERVKKLMVLK
jgi:hypothetical protein